MKRIVGIFAHPDDEALGPSGTLATLAQDHEVFLICVTGGEAGGKTPLEKKAIGEIRRREILNSAEVLGIRDVFFLGYQDGQLCNSLYPHLVEDIIQKVRLLQPQVLLTFEMRGVSGHIDHITVSMVTSYIFTKLPFVKKLMYFARPKAISDQMKDYFIFYPQGYTRNEVDEVISTEAVWETMVKAMYCHKSQLKDVERIHTLLSALPKEEYFFVRKK